MCGRGKKIQEREGGAGKEYLNVCCVKGGKRALSLLYPLPAPQQLLHTLPCNSIFLRIYFQVIQRYTFRNFCLLQIACERALPGVQSALESLLTEGPAGSRSIRNLFFFFFFQLEAGTSEKVCLVSRDEQSVLVVSYRDLKTCFEGAFNEIVSASLT